MNPIYVKLIKKTLAEFDPFRVHQAMKALDWRVDGVIPGPDYILDEAEDLLTKVAENLEYSDYFRVSTMGLVADGYSLNYPSKDQAGIFSLSFVVESSEVWMEDLEDEECEKNSLMERIHDLESEIKLLAEMYKKLELKYSEHHALYK